MVCSKCGCDRNITVKAKVHIGNCEYSLKRLCLICFLDYCNCDLSDISGDTRKIMFETREKKGTE